MSNTRQGTRSLTERAFGRGSQGIGFGASETEKGVRSQVVAGWGEAAGEGGREGALKGLRGLSHLLDKR